MRVSFDSSFLIYAAGFGDSIRQHRAQILLADLSEQDAVMPAQALGEFFRVMTGKAKWTPEKATAVITRWATSFTVVPTTQAVVLAAADLATRHRLAIWDAVILAAVRGAQCDTLLSEDMQDGFTWQGVTVVNPFANAQWRLPS